jgi:pyrroline-5-carboxylate reductase
MPQELLLVGCGKMGGALLRGWLGRGMDPASIQVVEPADAARAELAEQGIAAHRAAADLDEGFSPQTILFAVKPQAMDQVAPAYAHLARGGTVVMSIAAGKPIAYFEEKLGGDKVPPVVRVMPNTPAAVGRGISVLCANRGVMEEGRATCAGLMEAVGEVAWITDEALMDAVTAVSGSGPAYVFLLAECLGGAGEAAGLPSDLALKLARATVSGAGELLRQADQSAAQLRRDVASPGGTTEAALQVLMEEAGLPALMREAVKRATQRSRELAG